MATFSKWSWLYSKRAYISHPSVIPNACVSSNGFLVAEHFCPDEILALKDREEESPLLDLETLTDKEPR